MGWFSNNSNNSKTFEERINQGAEGDRADYESRSSNADPMAQADQKTKGVMSRLAAQRAANRTWGKDAPTDEDHHNRY